MSAIITGLVWEHPIQGEFGRPEKYVLLAYADHADQNGRNIYPSVELISKKTGYEERSVQAITRRLEEQGYLVEDGQGPKGTNRWMIPVERNEQGGAKIAPRIPALVESPEPPDMAGAQPLARGAKIAPLQNFAPEGIAPEGTAPEPSVEVKKIQEEDGKPAQNFGFSQALQDELERAGVYRANWTDVALYLRTGNDERDVFALLAWMRSKAPDAARAAQRFVARIRERAHAPDGFYPISQPDPVCAGVCVSGSAEDTADSRISGEGVGYFDDSVLAPIAPTGKTASDAWRDACSMLQLEMPRATYTEQIASTTPNRWGDVSGTLEIAARDPENRDWLESRITSTARRLLSGILNREVTVRWVVPASVREELPCQPSI